MNSRERLLAALSGKPVDHVPVAPFVYQSTVRAWNESNDIDVIGETIRFCETYGFDIIHRNIPVRFSEWNTQTSDWQVECYQHQEGNITVNRHIVHTPCGDLSDCTATIAATPYLSVSNRKEGLIKSPKDLETLIKFQPVPDQIDLSDLRRTKMLLGNKGICAPWISGVFNYMSDMRNLDELLTDPYEDPEFYHDLVQYVLHRLKAGLKPVLEEGVDMLSYAGNIANATLVGPSYFQKFILPYEKELIDYIQSYGTGVIYHNCGNSESLINCYSKLGMMCHESLSEAPHGDNHLEVWADSFPNDICLMGNIDQISFLKNATPTEVVHRAKHVLSVMSKRSRFILGTSDFLEDGTPEANLYALASAVHTP